MLYKPCWGLERHPTKEDVVFDRWWNAAAALDAGVRVWMFDPDVAFLRTPPLEPVAQCDIAYASHFGVVALTPGVRPVTALISTVWLNKQQVRLSVHHTTPCGHATT